MCALATTATPAPRERVKALLKERGITARKLSLDLGFSPNLLNNWFVRPNRQSLDPKTAIAIAEWAGWNVSQWLADLGLGPQPYDPDPLRRAVNAVKLTSLPRRVKEAIITLLEAPYAESTGAGPYR
jgi:lambda repressor-like predicted transcriptional regulator